MITYLFGAGASCPIIPASKDLSTSFEFLANDLLGILETQPGWPTNFINQTTFLSELRSLYNIAGKHNTVDTYAKKLFATNRQDDLHNLKCLLCAYFSLKQLQLNGSCDLRYDSFWASLVQDNYRRLPDNIKLISWNYDMQMEISYSDYCSTKSLYEASDVLKIYTNNEEDKWYKKDSFKVYKLNGTANVIKSYSNGYKDEFLHDSYIDNWNIETISQVIDIYFTLKDIKTNKKKPSLCFAWEDTHTNAFSIKNFIEMVADDVDDTEILIVVGYSFPFFNRSVDRKIIRGMKKLKTVYIQDINPNPVIESFKSILPDFNNIIPVTHMPNQFFLPPEL